MKYFFVFILSLLGAGVSSAQKDSAYIHDNYDKFEYQVPMRDGVALFTSVYVPRDHSRTYPLMLNRTPYSVAPYGLDKYKTTLGPSKYFVREGFIFVYQDVRGRYMSEGEFMDVRPHQSQKKDKEIDESSDTYDAVDWLLKNVKGNNGKVGVWGISYPGFYASMAAISGHPAIKAVSPQAPVTNWFLGDDFHHNGAFFLMDALSFYSGFGKSRPKPTTQDEKGIEYNTPDAYRFYLNLGTLADINEKVLKHELKFWNDIAAHPDYDDFWKARDARQYLGNIHPAVMTVGGLYDAEDCWGAQQTYKSIEKLNPGLPNTLVMGPWFHGGWARTEGDFFGDIKFGSKTAAWYREQVEFPFFMHYLKDAPEPKLAEATVFDIGADHWKEFKTWPPQETTPQTLYFNDKGVLSFDKPLPVSAFDEYVSDPLHPVPFTAEISNKRSREYMIEDQRFASCRSDVLSYETPVLTTSITLAGALAADLFVSTTGTDADYIVKLIDVYPDSLPNYVLHGKTVKIGGFQMLVRAEVMRGKYRKSFEKPEAFIVNQPDEVKFTLPDVMHTFQKGHRIMVQVQSSWFPLVDRNPQTFTNIYTAKETDFQKATERIYRQHDKASGIIVNVLK
jgi:putative CocE/NonD family hydrolase